MKASYPAAAEMIRVWILHNKLKPGTSLPTVQALSERLRLTEAITARACLVLVAGGILIREGRKLKVGPLLQNGPAIQGTVHVISYFPTFTKRIAQILTNEGIDHRFFELSHTKNLNFDKVIRTSLAQNPAGVIVWIARVDEATTEALKATTIPLVVCGEGMNNSPWSSIQIDLYRGTQMALSHLCELGHRNIAYVSVGNTAFDSELVHYYRCACLRLGLTEAALSVWRADSDWKEGLRETLLTGREREPVVSAILGADRVGICASELFSVPEQLSVVGYGGLQEGLENRPPLTTLALSDPEPVSVWACASMISQIRRKQAGLPSGPPVHALLVPDLLMRQSTRPLILHRVVKKVSSHLPAAEKDATNSWHNIYPFLKKQPSGVWRQLDISKWANHSFTRQHGWLGAEPLLHFPPGLRSIHGVPFRVLDESQNKGRAVITFLSPHSHSAKGKKLPEEVVIEAAVPVKALYFLHGCGYAKPVLFANYIINYRDGHFAEVPLISLGGSPSLASKRLGSMKPNLQDWWPTYGKENFPGAHYAAISDPSAPGADERYLYSLEWINPHPHEEISSIHVRVDSKAGPSLALIAVTALV